jgi:hypothetical protein
MTGLPDTAALNAASVVQSGYTSDLRMVVHPERGIFRSVELWLSRCDVADGEPFDNTVYVVAVSHYGNTVECGYYDGDNPPAELDVPLTPADLLGTLNEAVAR